MTSTAVLPGLSDDVLGALADVVTEGKKSSATAPVVPIPALDPLLREYAELDERLSDLKNKQGMVAAEIMAACEVKRLELCRKQGKRYSTIRLHDRTKYVTHVNGNKAFSDAELAVAVTAFGAAAARYFRTSYSVEVDVSRLSDEQKVALVNAGATVNRRTKATKTLEEERTLSPEVAAACVQLCKKGCEIKPVAYLSRKE